ncbi:MAG: hypothetical protein BGP24_14870 [Lysobacterales bacterium 69-70]|nr:hypothetical protein [Xanthomonadaceae bacterium]ODU35366.1 MAG: hypothetical protein ABS97_05695 [Xanthomonadaceae bacterium SCN 69-320]ODV16869.1 MAG: hypothetical protein ABT27_19020 [Xanthomonadaceae bacterium SCN 69-25]OJY94261.1 MAG: hypothetical protein BGP24_14870 [Xanthomonadales bacterium 69-70]
MKERPILFSGAMVRALLAGTKTQTRRIAKLNDAGRLQLTCRQWHPNDRAAILACPFGLAGDRLWVRETFKPIASGQVKGGYGKVRYGFAYQADGATKWARHETEIVDLTGKPPTGPMQFQDRPWKPSIHMPKRASRITLEITDVHVQRLQDISEADARAEGVMSVQSTEPGLESSPYYRSLMGPAELFRMLWESINGAGSWDANPWVWALTFKRVTP